MNNSAVILKNRAMQVIKESEMALKSIENNNLLVVEVGAYTYNDELESRLEITMTPKLYTEDQFREIYDGENFEAKVQGRYKPVYPSCKKVVDWYKEKIADAETILSVC